MTDQVPATTTSARAAEDFDLPVCLPSDLDLAEVDIDVLAAMTPAQRLQLTKKVLYLKGLAVRGVARDGLKNAGGISYTTLHRWRDTDPWFERMEVEATLESKDNLEAEAYRRAVQGVDEPVIFQGMVTTIFDAETGKDRVLTVKRYSDTLLSLLLKASDPEKYRENSKQTVEHTGAVGVLVVPGQSADPAAWEKVAREQQARFAGNTGDPRVIEHKP